MTEPVSVVDLFSGPGGLAEGFAALHGPGGQSRFRIALSIEMEPTAHRTLRLRAFLRKFPSGFPVEYYQFLNGVLKEEPDWACLYPQEWSEAEEETLCLQLGKSESTRLVQQRVNGICEDRGNWTVLLGGPPCQSYSIAGRARNAGNSRYDADNDERQSLYREYAEVLGHLQPAVAVMENVKGILSAQHNGRPIFSDVMDALMHAGGARRYCLFSLTSSCTTRSWDEGLEPRDFLVRSEDYGVPQNRHRVFVVCIRRDVAAILPKDLLPKLNRLESRSSVHDVISEMPMLRSRLSSKDDDVSWQRTVYEACKLIQRHPPKMTPSVKRQFYKALDRALESACGDPLPHRGVRGGTSIPTACPADLHNWLYDPNLEQLPNNETRGHVRDDLARYLYATAFARAFGRSPRAGDFPSALAPRHASWNTGRFDDRFRVQLGGNPSSTITSHISKDGHYFIHPDPAQCRSLTVREAARLQTFPDNYFFHGGRTQQYVQIGNAVPPYLARQIAKEVWNLLEYYNNFKDLE